MKFSAVNMTILGMCLIICITTIIDGLDLTKSVPNSLAYFSVIVQILLLFLAIVILAKETDLRILAIKNEIIKNSTALAIIVSLTATIGSLFMQFVVGWEPCELCWFQRIFMYPIPIILIHSLINKRSDGLKIVFPLAVIGAIIASYHYGVQFFNLASVCSIINGASECALKNYAPFGYMTIPMMALTAFIVVGILHKISEKETI